jgi:hypothetical protein
MTLTTKQIVILSELSIDIAKAMFVAAFTLPFFTSAESIYEFARLLIVGLIYVILSLQLVNRNPIK